MMRATAMAAVVVGAAAMASAQTAVPRGWVVFADGAKVSVEIARTAAERARGLMGRERLAPNDGMLFVFDAPGFYPFWMKDTLIPLDIIWLDSSSRVVSIAASVPPCKADPCPTYPPAGEAAYVVEVESGFAREHHVKVGDVLKLAGVGQRKQ